MKTSKEWQDIYKDKFIILDPDGWDRKNFEYSWHYELITEEEFNKRAILSTCRFMRLYIDKMHIEKLKDKND